MHSRSTTTACTTRSSSSDQHGKPLVEPVYRRLLSEFGRTRLQKHIDIVLVQKEHHQGTFRKSEVATFINRVQNDFAHPDWYTDLSRTSDLAGFDDIQPSDLTKKLYQSICRSS